jgi:hypothetical protein
MHAAFSNIPLEVVSRSPQRDVIDRADAPTNCFPAGAPGANELPDTKAFLEALHQLKLGGGPPAHGAAHGLFRWAEPNQTGAKGPGPCFQRCRHQMDNGVCTCHCLPPGAWLCVWSRQVRGTPYGGTGAGTLGRDGRHRGLFRVPGAADAHPGGMPCCSSAAR